MAEQPKPLRVNFAWMLLGSVSYAGSQWLLAVILARASGPEAVGIFALGTALSAPIIAFTQFALRQVLISDVARRYAFSDYLRLRLVATIAAFLTLIALSVLIVQGGQALFAVLAIGLGRCFESVSDIHFGFLQREGQHIRIATLMVLRGGLCVVAVFTSATAGGSVAVAGAAFCIACALSATLVGRGHSADGTGARRGRWSLLYTRSLLRRAAPLAVAQTFVALNASVPRYALQAFGGTGALGQYAVLEHLFGAIGLLMLSMGQAASPTLSRLFASGLRTQYYRLLGHLVAFGSILGVLSIVVSIVIGPSIVEFIYGANFSEAGKTISWIAVATSLGFVASSVGFGVTATGRFDGLGWRYALVAAVTASVAFVTVPQHELVGIAIALAAGNLVACIVPAIQLLRVRWP